MLPHGQGSPNGVFLSLHQALREEAEGRREGCQGPECAPVVGLGCVLLSGIGLLVRIWKLIPKLGLKRKIGSFLADFQVGNDGFQVVLLESICCHEWEHLGAPSDMSLGEHNVPA